MDKKKDYIYDFVESSQDSKIIDVLYSICKLETSETLSHSDIESRLDEMYTFMRNSVDDIRSASSTSSGLIKETMDHFMTKQKLSTQKGSDCEKEYLLLLQENLVGYEVDRNKNGYMCDLTVKHPDSSRDILIEIKNYVNSVPTSEVTKFHRDLLQNNCSGILVSDSSNIAKKTPFQLEELEENVYCFYICKNNKNIGSVISCIMSLMSLQSLHEKYINNRDNPVDIEEYQKCLKTLQQYDTFKAISFEHARKSIEDADRYYKKLLQVCDDISRAPAPVKPKSMKKDTRQEAICHYCGDQFVYADSNRKKHLLNHCKNPPSDHTITNKKTWFTELEKPHGRCINCDRIVNTDTKSKNNHRLLFDCVLEFE